MFPDGVSLNVADMGSLQVAALAQCELLQDRFVIMDLVQGDQPVSLALNAIQDFRDNVGTNSLKYYPWVRTIYEPDVHFRQLALVTPTNAAIGDAVIDSLTGDAALDALPAAVRTADSTVTSIVGAVHLGAMTNPGAIALTRSNFTQLSDHFAELVDGLRQLPTTAPDADVRQRFNNLIVLPRALVLALQTLDASSATLPTPLVLALTDLRGNTDLRATISGLVAYEKNAGVMDAIAAARAVGDVSTDYASLDATDWIAPNANVGAIPASGDVFTGASLRETALNAASALHSLFDPVAAAMSSLFSAADFLAGEAENQLFARHPVFAAIASQVTRTMVLLPPSGAVAGVYAAVDQELDRAGLCC